MEFLARLFSRKKRVGVFSFTCCEGCAVSFIETFNSKLEDYMKKMKIVSFRALMPSHKVPYMDIALVEGSISTQSELNKLLEIRKKTKKLVALGSGAANGYPSNQRNKFSADKKKNIQPLLSKFKQLKTIEPLNKYVHVDDVINGCPINEKEMIKKMEGYLNA